MTPEEEVLEEALTTLRTLVISSRETLTLVPELPSDPAVFAALPVITRVASTAALKQFEQLEDTLNSLFRVVLRSLGVRLKGLYPLDIGNHMEELDVIDDGTSWLAVVQLRNELVHEYPGEAADRLVRLRAAIAFFPLLFDAAARVDRAIITQGLLKRSR